MDLDTMYQAFVLTAMDVVMILIILAPFVLLRVLYEMMMIAIYDIHNDIVLSGEQPSAILVGLYDSVVRVKRKRRIRRLSEMFGVAEDDVDKILFLLRAKEARSVFLRKVPFVRRVLNLHFKPEVFVLLHENSDWRPSVASCSITYSFGHVAPTGFVRITLKDVPQ